MKDSQNKKYYKIDTVQNERKLRRDFLKYAGLGASGLALSSCACTFQVEETEEHLDTSKTAKASSALSKSFGNVVDNYTQLRDKAVPDEPDDFGVLVRGYESIADGGEGMFFWDLNELSPDNDGTIIKPDTVEESSPGRWVRLNDGQVNVKWFGAKGNGNTNDIIAIQAAIDAAGDNGAVLFPSGDYRYDGQIDFDSDGQVVHFIGVQIVPSHAAFCCDCTGLSIKSGRGSGCFC